MTAPLVSIITPAYNSGRFIDQTISSARNQTWTDWEMIIVDDGSSDDTAQRAKRATVADSRIRFLQAPSNGGVARARNIALREARGRYIAFLDSDDLWEPEKLDRQITFMRRYEVGVSFSAYSLIDEQGVALGRVGCSRQTISYRDMLNGHRVGCLTVVVDRDIVGAFEFPLFKGASDFAGWLSILRAGHVAHAIPDDLAVYRVVSASLSRNKLRHARRVWDVYRGESINAARRVWAYSQYSVRGVLRHITSGAYRRRRLPASAFTPRSHVATADSGAPVDLEMRLDGSSSIDAGVSGMVGAVGESPRAAFPGGFTVLMAVYCRDDARLFEQAIESVRHNSLKPDEFLLMVDGPVPAPIEQVIRRYSDEGSVRPVRLSENVGLAKALNHGLALVRTAWVVRADADDVNVPHRFETQAEAILRVANQVDVLGGAILEVDKRGAPLAIREVPLTHQEIVRRLGKRSPFNHMTVAYRLSTVREAGGYPTDMHLKEDYGLWASMIAKGARCQNINHILVKATTGIDMYRRRGGLRYVKSEWRLQFRLFDLGCKGLLSAVLYGHLRSFVFLLPSSVRGWIYLHLLRKRPGSSASAV